MTETTFVKNLRKWFFGSLLIQVVLGAVWIIYTSGTMSATVAKNTQDIQTLITAMENKADIGMVQRMKVDNDNVQRMILDNTKELKQGQHKLMETIINHLSK